MPKTIPSLSGAPAPVAPYSVAAGGPTPHEVADQTDLVLRNIGAILADVGLGYGDVVKTTIFLSDIRDYAAVNEVYGRYFATEPPARSAVQAAALPMPQFKVEIETIAAR